MAPSPAQNSLLMQSPLWAAHQKVAQGPHGFLFSRVLSASKAAAQRSLTEIMLQPRSVAATSPGGILSLLRSFLVVHLGLWIGLVEYGLDNSPLMILRHCIPHGACYETLTYIPEQLILDTDPKPA